MGKTIEKELKDIPFELRTLRLEKGNQETENRGLFNKKVALLESITDLGKEQAIEKEKHKKLVAINVAEGAKAKKREEGYAVRESELDARDGDIMSKEEAHADNVAELERDKATLEQSRTTFKKKQVDFNDDKKVFGQEKIEHQKNVDVLEVEKKDVNTRSSIIGKKEEVTTKNENDTITNLDKAKELKVLAEEGNKKLKEKEKAFAEKERLFDLKKVTSEKEKQDFALEKEEFKKGQDRVKAKDESLDRAYGVLNQAKREDRVKRLRVEKLIREHGIEKEIKDLEKSLKK